MKETSSEDQSEHSYFGDEIDNIESDQNKNNIDFSKTSSNPECVLDNVNKKIKSIIENGKDLSYSNSNSKISDHFQNKEQFLYSQYWLTKKKSNNDTDSSSAIIENKKNQKIKEKDEEKILYNSDEEENNINNINNKFDDDDFDEEDMEEKTIEKKENDINEINSIKVNNNNLNNKDNLSLTNNSNSNNDLKQINPNNNINSNINNITLNTNINEKINTINTPNKLSSPPQTPNNSFMPYLYNTNQVHSFISSYNNYPSNLSKGSFISTNNSSNTKFKKNEEHSEIEEDEIKLNNNSIFTHGNKFGPHLIDYSHIQSNTINLEQNNLNSINSINSFNMSNNFLYNRIPKMNLNMVYYIPIQQQAIPTNNNYINNNKIITNLNNNINSNENINNNININLQNQNKENNVEVNNNIINNNKNGNGNNNINNNSNNNGNKIIKKEKEKEKEKENSNSKEKKTKNKSQNNNSNQNLNANNNINNINNFRNNNNTNNSTNYKNNPNYKPNDNHNSNPISSNITSTNTSSNITQGNKCEKNLLNLDDIVTGKDTRTTVMIRNIPIKYTDSILIKDLEEFKGKYDCLYMPYDYEKKGNKGYAFINFVNPLHILYFHEKFNGKKWPLFESSKICELNSANFQGIYEIQKHSKNYKGYKKPLFYSEPNKNSSNKENIVIPSKYLNKLKVRFPKIKFKENKAKKIITVDSFE